MPKPPAADYDVWQDWGREMVKMYADCALRHIGTVQAWPK